MSLATLAEIGIKAMRLQEAMEKRRSARVALNRAYASYRHRHGNGRYFDKTSDRYALMMAATDREYSVFQSAQHDVQGARRSLERACKRAQRELKAGASAETAVRRIMEKAS